MYAAPDQRPALPAAAPKKSRVWVLVVLWTFVCAIASGAGITLQSGHGLFQLGLEFLPRVASLAIVRELGSSAATCGVLFALVTWTHGLSIAAVRDCRSRAIPCALLASLAGLPAALAVGLASSLLVAHFGYDVSVADYRAAALQTVRLRDFLSAVLGFGFHAGAVGVFSWYVLPLLARLGWRLLPKLAATWAALVLVNWSIEVVSALSRLSR